MKKLLMGLTLLASMSSFAKIDYETVEDMIQIRCTFQDEVWMENVNKKAKEDSYCTKIPSLIKGSENIRYNAGVYDMYAEDFIYHLEKIKVKYGDRADYAMDSIIYQIGSLNEDAHDFGEAYLKSMTEYFRIMGKKTTEALKNEIKTRKTRTVGLGQSYEGIWELSMHLLDLDPSQENELALIHNEKYQNQPGIEEGTGYDLRYFCELMILHEKEIIDLTSDMYSPILQDFLQSPFIKYQEEFRGSSSISSRNMKKMYLHGFAKWSLEGKQCIASTKAISLSLIR